MEVVGGVVGAISWNHLELPEDAQEDGVPLLSVICRLGMKGSFIPWA